MFPQVPLFKKIVRFFHSFVDSCIGTICHHIDFTGRVLLSEYLFNPETTYFTRKKMFGFFWQGTDPKRGPICS